MPARVVIIGGGLSGLTAAYELSRTAALRERYDVTVYQMGWRLGGKLASGRNPDLAFRNEEHGLHIWFGFYQNAFRLLGELDARWDRPVDFPFPSLCDGFTPESYTPVGDRDGEGFRPWHLHFPRNAGWPGTGDVVLSGWEALTHMVGWFAALLRMAADSATISSPTLRRRAPWPVGPAARRTLSLAAQMVDAAAKPLVAMLGASASIEPSTRIAMGAKLGKVLALVSRGIIPLVDTLADRDPRFGHPRAIIETTLAFLRGVLSAQYGILADLDFDRLNHLDFRDFLVENGARRETVDNWSGIRGLYDAMFQFIDGDPARPSFEAGTASRILLRAGLLYRGAALWVPRAGMGELLIAPLYDVLRSQGVHVELFHELEHIETSGDRIERLHFRVQAHTRDGTPYRPTFTHRGLSCWGAAPDWSQLECGDEMAAIGIDLESPGSGFADDRKVLDADVDFDHVILALPLGVLAARRGEANPCAEVVRRSTKLVELCRRASLSPSLSVQIWTNRCLGAPGGGSLALSTPPSPPNGGPHEIPRHYPAAAFGWCHPLSVWADMRPLLRHESWPATHAPVSSYYLCGAWPASSNDPVAEMEEATTAVAAQLDGPSCHWPGFTWSALHAPSPVDDTQPDHPTHAEILADQLVRVNVRASDLCDGAAVGTSRFRPDVADTGLSNLTYCGTWTRTGINSSCVEAAVMTGLAAARAISGEDKPIVGETFLARAREVPEPVERAGVPA